MTCDQAAEFVSALYDGETIPRAAAIHVSGCETCRKRLASYCQLSAEMRCAASLALTEQTPVRVFDRQPEILPNWWTKGWEGMKIPRLVFAGMLVGIAVLGSGLAVVGVHAQGDGTVMLLKITSPGRQPTVCPLSTLDKKWNSCTVIGSALSFEVQALSKEGDRLNLGVRARYQAPRSGTSSITLAGVKGLPEEKYSFDPGKGLQVQVAGFGALTITGEWIDHIPAMIGGEQAYDPGPSDLRIVSPVLLRGNKVAGDMQGGSAIVHRPGEYVALYMPGIGQFQFSLSQTPGTVEAHVQLNRVTFESDGQPYTLVTGAPITRGNHVWVHLDADFKPSRGAENGYIGTANLANAGPANPTR
jgi:hypothetical protein